jgi:hypothetical protein
MAKLKPATVTDAPPVATMFACPMERTGASKLYPSTWVPATAPTVTPIMATFLLTVSGRHTTVVDEIQVEVEHACLEILELTEKSVLPKLRPVTVTDAAPLCGVFSSPYDDTGESKESIGDPVPAIAPTVTIGTIPRS